jgi:hypothetical protein
VNFGWEAAKDAAGVEAAEQRIKLPSSFSIPLPIGGLPFSLEVSEALLLHPAFTGGKEVARGRFNVAYNGVQGFSLDQGNVNQEGQGNAEGSIVDNFSLSPIAPVGFVAAVAMPRIELKLGTDTGLSSGEEIRAARPGRRRFEPAEEDSIRKQNPAGSLRQVEDHRRGLRPGDHYHVNHCGGSGVAHTLPEGAADHHDSGRRQCHHSG